MVNSKTSVYFPPNFSIFFPNFIGEGEFSQNLHIPYKTILMHNKIIKRFCNPVLEKLTKNNCKIFADRIVRKNFNGKSNLAKEKSWSTEYLSAKVSVKCVKNVNEAINHINKYGTMHTDASITKNK